MSLLSVVVCAASSRHVSSSSDLNRTTSMDDQLNLRCTEAVSWFWKHTDTPEKRHQPPAPRTGCVSARTLTFGEHLCLTVLCVACCCWKVTCRTGSLCVCVFDLISLRRPAARKHVAEYLSLFDACRLNALIHYLLLLRRCTMRLSDTSVFSVCVCVNFTRLPHYLRLNGGLRVPGPVLPPPPSLNPALND